MLYLWRQSIFNQASKSILHSPQWNDKDQITSTKTTKEYMWQRGKVWIILKLRGFGPRANYTTERPPLVGEVSANFLLRIEGVAWSAQRITTVVHLGFLDRSRYFAFK
jgi:hypothetical protein